MVLRRLLVVVGLLLGAGSDSWASRKLLIPTMRLRVDGAGSTGGEQSALYPLAILRPSESPLPDRPLKVMEARFRFEFANISAVAQHLSLYARPGTRIGVQSTRWNFNGYEGFTHIPSIATMTNRRLLGSLNLGSYQGSSDTLSANSNQAIILAVSCDFFSLMKCSAGTTKIDSAGALINEETDILTVAIEPTMQAILQRDALTELIGNFEVEITEDRGAVTGTVGGLGNRVGGYYQTLQQAAGYIALNGGRPF